MLKNAISVNILFLGILSFISISCGGLNLKISPMPKGCTFTGLWDTNYGELTLTQTKTVVTGKYEYQQGRLKGVVTDNTLYYDWIQKQNNLTGKGYFQVNEDCKLIKGQWGYGKSRAGGGEWSGNRGIKY